MKITLVAAMVLILSACSSSPPLPPEPEGPLIPVNINQPHKTFGEKTK